MIDLQKRFPTKTSSGWRTVKSVGTPALADEWLRRNVSQDVRAVDKCGCIGYISGNWELCGDHAR